MRGRGIIRCEEACRKWASCSCALPGENVGCQSVRVVLGWMEQIARKSWLAQRKTGVVAELPGHNRGDAPMRSGHGYLPASSLLFNSYSLVLEFKKYIIKIQLYVYIKTPLLVKRKPCLLTLHLALQWPVFQLPRHNMDLSMCGSSRLAGSSKPHTLAFALYSVPITIWFMVLPREPWRDMNNPVLWILMGHNTSGLSDFKQ